MSLGVSLLLLHFQILWLGSSLPSSYAGPIGDRTPAKEKGRYLKFLALTEPIFYDARHHNQKERTVSSFLSLLLPEDSFFVRKSLDLTKLLPEDRDHTGFSMQELSYRINQ